jgi:hypothetical protein
VILVVRALDRKRARALATAMPVPHRNDIEQLLTVEAHDRGGDGYDANVWSAANHSGVTTRPTGVFKSLSHFSELNY